LAKQKAIPQTLLAELMLLCRAGQDAKQTKQCFENPTETVFSLSGEIGLLTVVSVY